MFQKACKLTKRTVWKRFNLVIYCIILEWRKQLDIFSDHISSVSLRASEDWIKVDSIFLLDCQTVKFVRKITDCPKVSFQMSIIFSFGFVIFCNDSYKWKETRQTYQKNDFRNYLAMIPFTIFHWHNFLS